jgi:tetratricopeptide (TPR) repeat protein
MPSHIFIQRGMWERVSRSNDDAYAVARALWEEGDRVNDMTHSNDWGHYGDLQRGAWADAQKRLEIMDEIVAMSEGQDPGDRWFPLRGRDWMQARQILETEQWQTRELGPEVYGSGVLASGISAVELGKGDEAKAALERLEEMLDEEDGGGKVLEAQHQLLLARIAAHKGKERKAIAALDEAVRLNDSTGPPAGTPSTAKPPRELYGEILLDFGRPREAAAKFEELLLLMPNRRLALRGLAEAHEAMGDAAKAEQTRQRIAEFFVGE